MLGSTLTYSHGWPAAHRIAHFILFDYLLFTKESDLTDITQIFFFVKKVAWVLLVTTFTKRKCFWCIVSFEVGFVFYICLLIDDSDWPTILCLMACITYGRLFDSLLSAISNEIFELPNAGVYLWGFLPISNAHSRAGVITLARRLESHRFGFDSGRLR